MSYTAVLTRPVQAVALAGAACLALTACGGSGSSSKTASGHDSAMTATAADAAHTTPMSGMSMGASGKAVDGIKPIPTQVLGSADWQHMRIEARAMTAVPFIVDDGQSERMVKPSRHTSFHLMVTLSDERTKVAIPYATVWATIRRPSGKVVFDERQWPMLSEYMGPHYGNNVTLPGAGRYTLSLLVSPPVAARHIEYQNVWRSAHRVNLAFDWKPSS